MSRRQERRAGWFLAQKIREDRHYVPKDGHSLVNRAARRSPSRGSYEYRHSYRSRSTSRNRSRRRSRSPVKNRSRDRHCRSHRDPTPLPRDSSGHYRPQYTDEQKSTVASELEIELNKRRARSERFGTEFNEEKELEKLRQGGYDDKGISVRGRGRRDTSYKETYDQEFTSPFGEKYIPYEREFSDRCTTDSGIQVVRSRMAMQDESKSSFRRPTQGHEVMTEYRYDPHESRWTPTKDFVDSYGLGGFDAIEQEVDPVIHSTRQVFLGASKQERPTDECGGSIGINIHVWEGTSERIDEKNRPKNEHVAEKLERKLLDKYGVVSSKRGFGEEGRCREDNEYQHLNEEYYRDRVEGEENAYFVDHSHSSGSSTNYDNLRTDAWDYSFASIREPVSFKLRLSLPQETETVRMPRVESKFFPDVPLSAQPALPSADEVEFGAPSFAENPMPATASSTTSHGRVSQVIMASQKSGFNISTCARPNVLALEPYRCARDDYKDNGTNILLDANENAYGPGLALNENGKLDGAENFSSKIDIDLLGLNRYPDPHQIELKQKLCKLRNTHVHTTKTLTPEHLFVGVGSDEAIDALLRAFCRPGSEKILTCPPTYGMYKVSAMLNDLAIVPVPLTPEKFQLQPQAINDVLSNDPLIKLVYICSPGNPTAALIDKNDIQKVLEHPTWNGVVVLDEAYIDFAPEGSSLAEWVTEWPNLVVMQTLSKAFGLAGIRLGAAFTSPEIAALLNKLKAPYNVSNPTSQLAQAALEPIHLAVKVQNVNKILDQRSRLIRELPRIPGVGRFLGGFDSNFLLVEMLEAPDGKPSNEVANTVYETLADARGVVVRFRGREFGCFGCLRITIGTERECDKFLAELKSVLQETYQRKASTISQEEEDRKEEAASLVIA